MEFPRAKPDDARAFAEGSRAALAALPTGDTSIEYANEAVRMLARVAYMLWGGGRSDLLKDVAVYANEKLLEAIADACPESEIVAPQENS